MELSWQSTESEVKKKKDTVSVYQKLGLEICGQKKDEVVDEMKYLQIKLQPRRVFYSVWYHLVTLSCCQVVVRWSDSGGVNFWLLNSNL